jgi:hypothetical protein
VVWIVPRANLVPWRHSLLSSMLGGVAYFRLVSFTPRATDDTVPVPECSVNMLPATAPMFGGNTSGGTGPDDGVTPNPVSGVTVTAGLSMLVLEWSLPTNTPLRRLFIYESTDTVKPGQPQFAIDPASTFFFRTGLPSSATRYYWIEVQAINGRRAIVGPFNNTTRAGINLADVVPGMTLVEIVNALPTAGNFDGRTVFLTTNKKLYRYDGTAGAFVASVPTVDLTGQITQTQITDSSISTSKLAATAVTAEKIASAAITAEKLAADSVTAGAIAAGAITAAAVGANEIITNTANIADAIITSAKIVSLVADKISAGYLNAIKLRSSYINSGVQLYHTDDEARLFPTTAHVYDQFNGAGGTTVTDDGNWHYLTSENLIFNGWKRGSAGFSSSRFGHPNLRMDMTVAAGVNFVSPGVNTYLQIGPAWRTRTSGGAWGAWQTSGWVDAQQNRVTTLCAHFPANIDSYLDGDTDLQVGIAMQLLNGGPGISSYIYSGGDIWARIYNF